MKIISVHPTRCDDFCYELRFVDEGGNEHTPAEIPGLHSDYLAVFRTADAANTAADDYVAETGCGYTPNASGGPAKA